MEGDVLVSVTISTERVKARLPGVA
jgi:hypothetical protein